MVALAHALLLLQSEPAFDTALNLAQNLNAATYQHLARRQAFNAVAGELRVRLAEIEEQIRRVA